MATFVHPQSLTLHSLISGCSICSGLWNKSSGISFDWGRPLMRWDPIFSSGWTSIFFYVVASVASWLIWIRWVHVRGVMILKQNDPHHPLTSCPLLGTSHISSGNWYYLMPPSLKHNTGNLIFFVVYRLWCAAFWDRTQFRSSGFWYIQRQCRSSVFQKFLKIFGKSLYLQFTSSLSRCLQFALNSLSNQFPKPKHMYY